MTDMVGGDEAIALVDATIVSLSSAFLGTRLSLYAAKLRARMEHINRMTYHALAYTVWSSSHFSAQGPLFLNWVLYEIVSSFIV